MTGTADAVRLGIVGLGRVGATAPAVPGPDRAADIIRNHLEAGLAVDGIEVAALIEPDGERIATVRADHSSVCETPAYASLADIPPGALDVIALCTPTTTRAADVAMALTLRPQLLLVEKPLAVDSGAAESLVRAAAAAGVALRVNFNRRFDDAICRHHAATSGARPVALVCRYNKGLLNYASHMVDLLLHWYGAVEAVQAIGPAEAADDPTVSFRCDMAAGMPAYVIGLPGAQYDQFEIDVLQPQGRVSYANNGVEKRAHEAVADLYYPGYAHLRERTVPRDDTPTGGFVEYYRAVVAALREDGPLPGCTGPEALANLLVLEAVKASLADGGRKIIVQSPALAGADPV